MFVFATFLIEIDCDGSFYVPYGLHYRPLNVKNNFLVYQNSCVPVTLTIFSTHVRCNKLAFYRFVIFKKFIIIYAFPNTLDVFLNCTYFAILSHPKFDDRTLFTRGDHCLNRLKMIFFLYHDDFYYKTIPNNAEFAFMSRNSEKK